MMGPKKITLLTVAFLLFCGGAFWFSTQDDAKEEISFEFRANNASFVGLNVRREEHLGATLVKAGVARLRGGGWTRLTPSRIAGICGGLLSGLTRVKSDEFDRSIVFRVHFTAGMTGERSSQNETGDIIIPVNVRDGACITPDQMDQFPLGLPGAMNDWALVGVTHDDAERIVTLTFDPHDGISYDAVITAFDPLFACQAALQETFDSDVTPLDRSRVDRALVVARNFRGNQILNFATYRPWEQTIAGSICVMDEGREG